MPLRKPVFMPPFNVVRASHVELAVRDLGRTRAFYVDCLGYLVSAEGPGAQRTQTVSERFLKINRGNPVGFADAAFAGGATLIVTYFAWIPDARTSGLTPALTIAAGAAHAVAALFTGGRLLDDGRTRSLADAVSIATPSVVRPSSSGSVIGVADR